MGAGTGLPASRKLAGGGLRASNRNRSGASPWYLTWKVGSTCGGVAESTESRPVLLSNLPSTPTSPLTSSKLLATRI